MQTLKIDCLENDINGHLFYTGFITFKDLSERSQLKPLTVNRIINNNRIGKMLKYIKDKESFYPPIVLALDEKIESKYYNNHKTLEIELCEEEKPLVIIDGQHRYKSIHDLVESKKTDPDIIGKKQAVFIITTINENEQRKVFMDINENMQKVSSVSKLIASIDIVNYLSLKTVKDLNIVKKINFLNDQCTTYYPYKFIIEGNKRIFKNFDIEKFDSSKVILELERLGEVSTFMWSMLLTLIEENSNLTIGILEKNETNKDNLKFLKTEIFIEAFMLNFMEKYNYNESLTVDYLESLDIGLFEKNFNEFLQEFQKLSFQFIENKLEGLSKKDKRDKLSKIIGGKDDE